MRLCCAYVFVMPSYITSMTEFLSGACHGCIKLFYTYDMVMPGYISSMMFLFFKVIP